jgi:hypothetical protein
MLPSLVDGEIQADQAEIEKQRRAARRSPLCDFAGIGYRSPTVFSLLRDEICERIIAR